MNNCELYKDLHFGNSTRWPGPSLSFSTCMTTTAEHKQGFLNELTYRKHRMYKTIQGPGGSNIHANHMIYTQGTLQLSQRRHNSQRNYPHTDNTDWRSRDPDTIRTDRNPKTNSTPVTDSWGRGKTPPQRQMRDKRELALTSIPGNSS